MSLSEDEAKAWMEKIKDAEKSDGADRLPQELRTIQETSKPGSTVQRVVPAAEPQHDNTNK
eukprot:scaffold662071_cov57-Prasinocladus_malaysianus.AAC.1